MRRLSNGQLRELLAAQRPPCLSLYQPTHRRHPENQQDPIRYRNLLKSLEASLRNAHPDRDVRTLLEPFEALLHDDLFRGKALDGLAVFGTADSFRVVTLPRPVPELVVVADSFHTKPLIRLVQSADRYQILAFDRHAAKLYEGDRDTLDEVEMAEGVPRTIEDALGTELTEPHSTVASYGAGAGGPRSAHGSPAMHHGHGGRKDQTEIDDERFFRALDRAILEHHSRPSGLPLMLAALPEHHAMFRKVSHNPQLMADGIRLDPELLSVDRLRQEAWKIVEPAHRARLTGLKEAYGQSVAKGLGSADLTDIAEAAIAGRVGTLMVEAERQIPGRIDGETGAITTGDLAHPGVDDLLDDLAELVLRKGGEVTVAAADEMPTATGAAATFRF